MRIILDAKKILSYSAIALVVFSILGYSLWRTKDIILGPRIIMEETGNKTTSNAHVNLSGRARRITEIRLNGREIFTDQDEKFRESVLLSYGYNMLTLEARDKFGRGVKKTIELVYQ